MLESTGFRYNNVHSNDIGGVNCQVGTDLFEESFLSSRSIEEESIAGRDKPYFMGLENEPLEFPMTIYFDVFDKDKRREVARLFSVNYYKPLIFDSNPDRIFYCMYDGDFDKKHNGQNQGYITLNMKCDSPYSYSPVYTTRVYDLTDNSSEGTEIKFENYGDTVCKPQITIEVEEDESISIANRNDGKHILEMENLLEGDTVVIDCEDESIESNDAGVFKYDNHNNVYIRFVRGVNRLKVHGKCKLQFKYQFTLYQG